MILSLGDFLWSLLVIFFMVIYFMMLFQVIVDIFRRHDASGGKKALWLLFLLCVPLVGLLAYMMTWISRPSTFTSQVGRRRLG